MYRNPIDQDQFKKVVTEHPGIDKPRLISRLRADKGKVKRAQTKAVRDGWLHVQLNGKVIRYYTMKYAVENDTPKTITAEGGVNSTGGKHCKDVLEYLDRVRFIDSCWLQVASHRGI